jgi:hypothetical protein
MQAQLLGQKPSCLTPGNCLDERSDSIGERSTAEFGAEASRQMPVEETALFPIQARPEFREQIILGKGECRLAHILIGGRMRKQNHVTTVWKSSR